MRLAIVNTLDEANAFPNSYISKFNQQFAIMDGMPSCFDVRHNEKLFALEKIPERYEYSAAVDLEHDYS